MVSPRVRIAVIGYGRWGPNAARVVEQVDGAELVAICDHHEARRLAAAAAHPAVLVGYDLESVLASGLDAVVLATQPSTHHALAALALRLGLHALVEKPLALGSVDATDLVQSARRAGVVLMAGHTFLYHDAIRWAKDFLGAGRLGEVVHVHAERLNLGQVRTDVDVVWNLAPHDVSILHYLLAEDVVAVTAHGRAYVDPEVLDVAYLVLEFGSGVLGHVHVGWLQPVKTRRVTVVGSEAMLVFDDTTPDSAVTVHHKGVDWAALPISGRRDVSLALRDAGTFVPAIDVREPLAVELADFVGAIRSGTPPVADGEGGVAVVRVVEAASASLRAGGARISLTEGLPAVRAAEVMSP